MQILLVSLQKSSPLSVPRTNFYPSTKLCNALYIKHLQSYKWALKKTLHRKVNLYLCERYGYRNACSVMWNENGICISIHRGSLDIYIRFWEYSKGVGNYPDWSIIIDRLNEMVEKVVFENESYRR